MIVSETGSPRTTTPLSPLGFPPCHSTAPSLTSLRSSGLDGISSASWFFEVMGKTIGVQDSSRQGLAWPRWGQRTAPLASAHPGRRSGSLGGSAANLGETSASPGETSAHSGGTFANPGEPFASPRRSFANLGETSANPGEWSARPSGTFANPGETSANPGGSFVEPGETSASSGGTFASS